MLRMMLMLLISCHIFATVQVLAEETSLSSPLAIKTEETQIRKTHQLKIGTRTIEYESISGSLTTKKQEDLKEEASIYFTAYFAKQSTPVSAPRPITFCFNGGPGSSSVWLHMGCLGPKIINFSDLRDNPIPGSYSDNPHTLLATTDLVFIDPVSTGFSRPATGVDAKNFHGVDSDIDSLAEFIRLFLTRFDRWDSPRYLAGESYGTVRVVGLAEKLQDEYYIDCNGLILISSVLDFTTMDDYSLGNDLCYILSLPSYAASTWYHHKLPGELQNKKLQEFLAEVEEFTLHEYAPALLLGDKLSDDAKTTISKQLARYTAIPQETISLLHLRIPPALFMKSLLKTSGKVIGRYDARYTGDDSEQPSDSPTYDPSFYAVAGLFTSGLQNYMYSDLGLKKEERYYILGHNVQPWNWSLKRQPAGLGYLNITNSLRSTMMKNSQLKVFVASGYFDMATPYFATDYTLDHLQLPARLRQNIEQHYYEGGHMMYLNPNALKQFTEQLSAFFDIALK